MFLNDFAGILPGLPYNMYGMMDQLISSVGARFAGTFASTFSGYIHRIRGYHDRALVPDKGVYYINYPYEEDSYQDSLEQNERWSNSVWWPQDDAELYIHDSWSREFSFTWDMARDWLPPLNR